MDKNQYFQALNTKVMLKTFLKYLIYKNYNWQVKVKSRNPENAAVYSVAFPLFFLVLGSLTFFAIKFDFPLVGIAIVVFLVALIYFLEYFINKFISKYGMKNIINEFSYRTKRQERLGSFFIIIFTVFSTLLPFVIAIIMLDRQWY